MTENSNEFEVFVTLEGVEDVLDDAIVDAFYVAGCVDSTLSSTEARQLQLYFVKDGKQIDTVNEALASISKAVPNARIDKIEFYYQ